MRYNQFAAIAAMSMGLASMSAVADRIEAVSGLPKQRKRKANTPSEPHPAMPEGGWPESRQVRRARERAGKAVVS